MGEWAKDEDNSSSNQDWQVGWTQKIRKEPKGVALIIAYVLLITNTVLTNTTPKRPWNYPLTLSLQPLYGAIAAGCCAVIKPSEVATSFSSTLAELLPKYLDNDAFRVIEGAVPEITRLLELQCVPLFSYSTSVLPMYTTLWHRHLTGDHIFYTGNGNIARIISTAAARHLTPLTLELGGKSPVIIDPETDPDLAAKRILYGKSQNAGQVWKLFSPEYPSSWPVSFFAFSSASHRTTSSAPPLSFLHLSIPSLNMQLNSGPKAHSNRPLLGALSPTLTSIAFHLYSNTRIQKSCMVVETILKEQLILREDRGGWRWRSWP